MKVKIKSVGVATAAAADWDRGFKFYGVIGISIPSSSSQALGARHHYNRSFQHLPHHQ